MSEESEKERLEKVHAARPWLFKPGQSGNLLGKPKGTVSITTKVKRYLLDHPEDFEEIIKDYVKDKKKRELLWRMIDSPPKQPIDIGGELPVRVIVEQLHNAIYREENTTV